MAWPGHGSQDRLTFQLNRSNMSLGDMSRGDILEANMDITGPNYLPLTETTFFILLSLAPGSKHGYGILKEVESLSDGRVTFSTGTLYGALKRLLECGWIVGVDNPEPDETARPRKDYRLTETGRHVLSGETDRLRKLAKLAQLWLEEGEV